MKLKPILAFLLGTAIGLTSVSASAASGAVYTMTNAAAGNAVLVFNRSAEGQLSPAGVFPTGGLGTGGGLGNQGAIAIDEKKGFLFVINAGSNNISVLRITEDGLQLVDVAASGGSRPISLTVNRKILYVLNNGGAVGGSDTIAGFKILKDGRLAPIIAGLPLSAPSVGPAQIGFDHDGEALLVTEKATNKLDLFTVDDDAVAHGPAVVPSAGKTPFGFAFGKRDQVFVSEAFGGAANAGALSSYEVDDNALKTITAAASDKQTAPCWVVVTNDGRFTYTTNTGSGTVSGYSIGFDGSLQLLNTDGQTAVTGTGSTPIDAALSNDSRFLFVLTPGSQNIQGFGVSPDGTLVPVSQVPGIPVSANGLVAR
jgi:6-phosphogluconolactonase